MKQNIQNIIAEFIPIVLIFLFLYTNKQFLLFSKTILGKVISILIIIFYAFINKYIGNSYKIIDSFKNNNKKGVILMYATNNIIDTYAKYSIEINKKYANKNNYDFRLVTESYDDKVTHAWQKIPAAIELLNEGYDFVMYIDSDAIFYDQSIKIEDIISKYNNDIIICSDSENSGNLYKVNGGSLIVQNTEKSKKLLEQWWDLRYKYDVFAYEQHAMSDIVENKLENIDNKIISVAPETEFNSSFSEVLQYLNNHTENKYDRFVLHLMAIDDARRENVLEFINQTL